MLGSLYTGAAALNVLNRQHEQTSNNLANLNSSGFRRGDYSVIQGQAPRQNPNGLGFGPQLEKQNFDFSQGRLLDTKRPLDIAIAGDGFFAFQTVRGATVYSRDGRLARHPETGELLNGSQLKLLGEDGPIVIPPDVANNEITIAEDGSITAGDQELGKVDFVTFQDNSTLVPVGQSTFKRSNQTAVKEDEARVQQFFHEVSNVNPTSELISLIVAGRQYEAVQKASRTISETLQESIRA